MKKTVVTSVILSIIFILIGAGLSYYGFKTVNDFNEKKKGYIEISAKVVNYNYPNITEDSAYTIYEYEVDGISYKAQSKIQTNNLPPLGKSITIMYNPNDPNEVIFLDGSNYFMLVIGIIFCVAGLFLLLKAISLKKTSANIKYNNTDINNVSGPNKF